MTLAGTGGFLTETFKYIKERCEEYYPNIDTSELASKVIVGYDINYNNIGRTRINMTLAGDGFSDIRRVNTLTAKDLKKDLDFIITNIPYGKGDVALKYENSKDKFLKTNNNKRLEFNFLIKAIELLKKGGKALIIVPEGIMEAPTLSPLREYIIKTCKITAIISLPKFSFAPYTKWKTYVLFLEKRQNKLESLGDNKLINERIYSYIVDNDGYANSDKRFPTKLKGKNGEYLHDEMSKYTDIKGFLNLSKMEQAYNDKIDDTTLLYKNEWNEEIKGKKYGYILLKEILEEKTEKNPTVDTKQINNALWQELQNNKILTKELYDELKDISPIDSKGNFRKFKKLDYMNKENKLKDEFIEILNELNYEYDYEENKWYDKNKVLITHSLNLVPEKYFRKKEIKYITIEKLELFTSQIKNELKSFLEGVLNED